MLETRGKGTLSWTELGYQTGLTALNFGGKGKLKNPKSLLNIKSAYSKVRNNLHKLRDETGAVWKIPKDPAKTRPYLRKSIKEAIQKKASKNPSGDYIDPNNGKIIPKDGPFDYGHKKGNEWRKTQEKARKEGWTRRQVIEHENNSDIFQIEDPSSNRSHKFEAP